MPSRPPYTRRRSGCASSPTVLDTDDRAFSSRALRAWIPTARDRISVTGSAHLAAQLPEILRWAYYLERPAALENRLHAIGQAVAVLADGPEPVAEDKSGYARTTSTAERIHRILLAAGLNSADTNGRTN
ncbi:DUF2267 domain-containing protein [Nocardia sp. NBC_01009]|uniref:DUF2267 domain-containing protein n=1 Tax=Nocardia sp. NBC_01009 TaxID=2975996 RepID=UPI0038643549|nr:DUF2267 domain-containing protein [Nocardia sp. NBC_01009]